MATFHGFQLENMRSWVANEGLGTQATVYLNGEELGFWSDDGNGGVHRFDFPTGKLNELVAEQIPELAMDYGTGTTFPADMEIVLNHLADLQDFENQVKDGMEPGHAMVVLEDRKTGERIAYFIRDTGDAEQMDEMSFETAGEYAAEAGLGDCSRTLVFEDTWDEFFTEGESLQNCEEALEQIREYKQRVAQYL